ncbi:MAG: PAS domain S-box protein [Myxococcota bacterium]
MRDLHSTFFSFSSAVERFAARIAGSIRRRDHHRRALDRSERGSRSATITAERSSDGSLPGSAHDADLTWNHAETIEQASRAAEQMFGRNPGELIGTPLRRLIDSRGHDALNLNLIDASAAREADHERFAFTFCGVRSDGTRFPVEMTIVPASTEGRKAYDAFLRDLSAPASASADLKRSESLRTVIDTLPDAVLVHRDEILVYVNQSFVDLLGYARADDLLGMNLRELVHPDGWELVRNRLRELEVLGKPLDPCEERFVARDGRVVTFEMAKVPIEFDSRPSVVAIGRDVRGRQQADRRLRQAVESAPSGMIMTDSEGHIVLANSHVEHLFGYGESELLGQQIEMLIPERYRAHHPDLRHAYLANPSHRRMGIGPEFHALHKDGHEIPVEIILNPITMDDGVFVLSSIVDVRERKKVESLIAMADRMSAVGTLAAGVAHGINNPLTYVKGNLQFVRREAAKLFAHHGAGKTSSEESDLLVALDHAIEGADRIRDLVGDLLTYARHEPSENSPGIDLHAVLDSVTRMISNELKHRAQLETTYGAVPPVAGDSSRLAHALTNLLVNAAHSIPEGNARHNKIRIKTDYEPVSGLIEVEISDTGAGISAEVLPHVFDPFFTTKPVGRGVGLGLSVSQGIINGLGGTIWIESESGRGTRVHLRLPPGRVREKPLAKASPSTSERGSRRILLVDDEPRVLEMMARMLGHHDVETATGAREALRRIESGERFDVIFCDLMMPETTGAQLHGVLRATHPDLAKRVVFLTGGAFTLESRTFAEWVPNPVLQKPVELETLEAAIREIAPELALAEEDERGSMIGS